MRISRALVVLAGVVSLGVPSARGQEPPISVLRDWQFYNNTGHIFLGQGEYAAAETRFRTAIELIRPYDANDPRLLAKSYAALAETFYLQTHYAEAEPLARWVLTVRERSTRKVPPEALRDSLYLLAQIERVQGKNEAAEPLYRRALAIEDSLHGPNHPDTAQLVDDLATVCRDLGKLVEAEPMYRRAAAIRERLLAAGNPALAETAEHYAVLLRRRSREEEAAHWEARARSIRANSEKAEATVRAVEARPVRP